MKELDDLTDQIPDAADVHQGRLFNESLVKMMELLENGLKIKEAETEILKNGYENHQNALKTKSENLKDKTIKVKKIRVVTQKDISEIE
jgi:hypothetical protein